LPAKQIAQLRKAIGKAETSHMNKNSVAKLEGMAPSLEKSAAAAKTPADSVRMEALANVLKHPSA
jgi:hypothetical protein